MIRVAGIGIGANLGDRAQTFQSAIDHIANVPSIDLRTLSPIYETDPVGGPPNQPQFWNAVARIETSLDPESLLDALLDIERAHGRVRKERWGPRVLDLDILFMAEPASMEPVPWHSTVLTLPHPHLLERAFALIPLIDVFPELEPKWGRVKENLGIPNVAQGSQSIVVHRRHR